MSKIIAAEALQVGDRFSPVDRPGEVAPFTWTVIEKGRTWTDEYDTKFVQLGIRTESGENHYWEYQADWEVQLTEEYKATLTRLKTRELVRNLEHAVRKAESAEWRGRYEFIRSCNAEVDRIREELLARIDRMAK